MALFGPNFRFNVVDASNPASTYLGVGPLRTPFSMALEGSPEVIMTGDFLKMTQDGLFINNLLVPAQSLYVQQLFDESDVDVNFADSSYKWGGSTRVLGDLTANGDGSYDLAYGSFYAGAACTVMVEYETSTPATVSGVPFSWTDGSQRYEWEMIAASSGDMVPRIYTNTPTTYVQTLSSYPGVAAQVASNGIRRHIMTVTNGVAPKTVSNNWPIEEHSTAFGTLNTPTKITFGRRARFNDQPFANATLRRVVIWPRVLTDAELNLIGEGAEEFGVHLLGDSFLNGQDLLGALAEDFNSRDVYMPITQDNVGGADMDDHATRYALDTVTGYDISHWKDSTLVIMDGGLGGTAATIKSSIDTIVAECNHNRWVFVEPAPQLPLSDGGRAAYDALVADVVSHVTTTYGEQHFVPTYDEALAAGDGTTPDNDEIAKGLWPLSLKISTVDFHPSAAGYAFLAEQIDAKLTANGWVNPLPSVFAVSSFETGATTGVQNYTTTALSGISPSGALIFGANHQTANDASETPSGTSVFGVLDSSSQRAISTMSQDNNATTNSRHALSSAHAFRIANQTNYRKTATGSPTTGGISLNYSINNDNNQRMGYVAFGGAGAQAYVGTVNLGVGTSAINVSGIGFQPDAVICLGVGHDTDNTLIVDTKQHFGIALADGTQRSVVIVEDSGAAANAPHQALLTDAAVAELNATNGALVYKAVLSNFGADGFDITPSANAGNDLVYFLALKFSSKTLELVDYDTPTATGVSTIGSASITPSFALAVTTGLEVVDTFPGATSATQCGFGIAAINADSQVASSFRINSGSSNTDTGSLVLETGLLGPSNAACDAIKATFDSFVSGGVSLNFSSVEGTAKKGFALLVN